MRAGRAIVALARADFRERVRRYSFLLTLLFAIFLGYAAATGRISLQLGGYRGVYTSAWIGALVAMVTTCFVSLVGFYIVKSTVERDRVTGVGQILAATPLSKTSYVLGKFASNFAVLAGMLVVLAICAVLMQVLVGEERAFHPYSLLAPFVYVAIPALLLTAAMAVLFEVTPILRGGPGNIAWFFVWAILGIGLPEISGHHKLDPLGVMTIADDMMAGARAHIPGYKNAFAFQLADKPAKIVPGFHWQGVHWTAEHILLRGCWVLVAVMVVLAAAVIFDRFDSQRLRVPKEKKKDEAFVKSVALPEIPPDSFRAILGSKATQLTPLENCERESGLGQVFAAEARLAIKGQRWWWWAIAAGLFVAEIVAPLEIARGPILGTAWLWPILIWSAMGTREQRFGTRGLLFSAAQPVSRQLPACWLAGFAVASILGGPVALRLGMAYGWRGVLPWLAGAIFIPSLALALGVWSGTGKAYEGTLTALWYVGPMNHTPGLDFTGTANGPLAIRYAVLYLCLSAVLLAGAVLARARQVSSS